MYPRGRECRWTGSSKNRWASEVWKPEVGKFDPFLKRGAPEQLVQSWFAFCRGVNSTFRVGHQGATGAQDCTFFHWFHAHSTVESWILRRSQ